jgi:hypothetical protein
MSFHWRARLLFYVKSRGRSKANSKFVHRPQDSLLYHIGCVSIDTHNIYILCVIEGVPVWEVDVQPGATKRNRFSFEVALSILVYIECGIYVYSSSNHTTDNQLALNVVLWLFYGHNTTHIELLNWFLNIRQIKRMYITNLTKLDIELVWCQLFYGWLPISNI